MKALTTLCSLVLFSSRSVEKRCICSSLFSYDLLPSYDLRPSYDEIPTVLRLLRWK